MPLDEVESAVDIVKRFATGAMSYGSISREAHTTLAIAMNRIGGKSNTGEGGEESDRYKRMPNGNSMRSAIKQVASGRFGVTAEYLVNSDMMQIKMAQGAKPGEGGQLPGHKVDAVIAKVRHSTQGVGLISPPPHHDIYSIEDLKQLVYDLKNVNPDALVSVKLVSEVGVGTVAAGVAKCKSDHVTISGFEGGTGASPLTSIKHAGSPWEIGLAETHQTLVMNGLRSRIAGAGRRRRAHRPRRRDRRAARRRRVRLRHRAADRGRLHHDAQVPSQHLPGRRRDAGPGAAQALHRQARACDQLLLLRRRGSARDDGRARLPQVRRDGRPAADARPGQADEHGKAQGLDFSKLFLKPTPWPGDTIYRSIGQDHELEHVLDRRLIAEKQGSDRARQARPPRPDDPQFGPLDRRDALGRDRQALRPCRPADETIHIKLKGTAGQSFGAFLAKGVTLELEGDGNDYVGKGLSGGKIVVYPPKEATKITPETSIIIGNTALYGAIAGECYFRGVAGERFAVRNSGAIAVVEGVGDHGCEYMTGGIVVVIGETGRNFAAGMSGGIAYVLDEAGNFAQRCNMAMVELEPVAAEEEMMQRHLHSGGDLAAHGRVDVMSDMSRFDGERLHQLITNHARATSSARARHILENWDTYLPKFRKVMPVEYRRALAELAAQGGQTMLAAGE